jgi:hypothetical protein
MAELINDDAVADYLCRLSLYCLFTDGQSVDLARRPH